MSKKIDLNWSVYDITLAKEKLDWKPTVRLEEGLIEVINYFKQILSK